MDRHVVKKMYQLNILPCIEILPIREELQLIMNNFCTGFQLRTPFTAAPNDTTFVTSGSDATLEWNYLIHGSFSRVEILYELSGSWVRLVWKEKDGRVIKNADLPSNLTSRITIEGNATLVMLNVSIGDSGKYECRFVDSSGKTTTEVPVELVVKGEALLDIFLGLLTTILAPKIAKNLSKNL